MITVPITRAMRPLLDRARTARPEPATFHSAASLFAGGRVLPAVLAAPPVIPGLAATP